MDEEKGALPKTPESVREELTGRVASRLRRELSTLSTMGEQGDDAYEANLMGRVQAVRDLLSDEFDSPVLAKEIMEEHEKAKASKK